MRAKTIKFSGKELEVIADALFDYHLALLGELQRLTKPKAKISRKIEYVHTAVQKVAYTVEQEKS